MINIKKYFAKQSIAELLKTAKTSHELERTLGPMQLIMLGLGAIVGAGIFVFAGSAAAVHAGPAVIFSFVIAALACACAGLCYAELASMIPISGGAYTFAYTALGELPAWIVASMSMLICIFGASSVAAGWSGYLVSLLSDYGIHVPAALCHSTGSLVTLADGTIVNGIFNLPAFLIVLLITMVLHKGAEASATINSIIVAVKMLALSMFILIGAFYVQPDNWVPFIPENTGVFGEFGISGIIAGASMILLAFSGFDVVATAAQETKNPQRDLPVGILASLAISTIVYSMIAAVLTGIVKYEFLNVPQPVALAVQEMQLPWFSKVIKFSAVIGLTSVILALMYAAVRVLYTITHDGLLPKGMAKLHKKNHTPIYLTFGIGILVATLPSVLPSSVLAQLSSFGIAATFAMVCLITIVLRVTHANLERVFHCPLSPFIPLCGIAAFGGLMIVSLMTTYTYIALWFAFTLSIYFGYSQFNSILLQKASKKK